MEVSSSLLQYAAFKTKRYNNNNNDNKKKQKKMPSTCVVSPEIDGHTAHELNSGISINSNPEAKTKPVDVKSF